MTQSSPFAVIAVHSNNSMEVLTVLAASYQSALATAASLLYQRGHTTSKIVSALSLNEINSIKKMLERAAFIGQGNGLKADPLQFQERQLKSQLVSDLDDSDLDNNNLDNGFNNSSDRQDDVFQSTPDVKKSLDTLTKIAQISPYNDLMDLSKGKKGGERKTNVVLDDFYEQ